MSSDNNSKETANLLMTIVRSLSSQSELDEREFEQKRLEKAFRDSDKNLDKLVGESQTNLNLILQAFTTVSTKISLTQEKISLIKENLQSCKNLLHCKRDELRKLWIEGIEHKTVVEMLDQIEKFKGIPEVLHNFIDRKHFLHATQLVVESLFLLDGNLGHVEALKDIKSELLLKKEELYEGLIDELHRQIYVKATSSIVKGFQRVGSNQTSGGKGGKEFCTMSLPSMSQLSFSENNFSDDCYDNNLHFVNIDISNSNKFFETVDLESIATTQQIIEDTDVDPEKNCVNFVSLIIESLATLDRMLDATEAIRSRIRPGLLQIVQRAVQQVSDAAFLDGEETGPEKNQTQLLRIALDLVLKQFKVVARLHQVTLCSLQRVRNSRTASTHFDLYTLDEVWSSLQHVIESFIGDYIDLRNAIPGESISNDSTEEISVSYANTICGTNASDIDLDYSVYFTKKRANRIIKKRTLFRFESSSHAISMNSYLREQRAEIYGSGDVLSSNSVKNSNASSSNEKSHIELLLTKPDVYNVTIIYKPLRQFILDIEAATGHIGDVGSDRCRLHLFLARFVERVFVPIVRDGLRREISTSTHAFHSQRQVIEQRCMVELKINRPLFLSTVEVYRQIQRLRDLIGLIPEYGDHFAELICEVLEDYLVTCQNTYSNIVAVSLPSINPVSSENFGLQTAQNGLIISAAWAKDEDINRFLRCLPNWRLLKDENIWRFGEPLAEKNSLEEISEEDTRVLNSKESAILTSNLSSLETLIPQHEIITDMSQLRALANLCESLIWFSKQILSLISSLKPHRKQYQQASRPTTLLHSPTRVTTSITKNKPSFPSGAGCVKDDFLKCLTKLSQQFDDLADECLLVLHLEVRVHCFHFLLPMARQSNYAGAIDDMEPDICVRRLAKVLAAVDEQLAVALHPTRRHYVVDGLGHLSANILINSAQFLRRINENGIRKMVRNALALQQCTAQMSGAREVDLERARQYYELLYLTRGHIDPTNCISGTTSGATEDPILATVRERGPQYTEPEYTNLLSLAHRSEKGGSILSASEPENFDNSELLDRKLHALKTVLMEFESMV